MSGNYFLLIFIRSFHLTCYYTPTTHHSPLTTHHSPLTTHHSPLTSIPQTHNPPLALFGYFAQGIIGVDGHGVFDDF